MMFFFFKQKTAYEMRISDWSSDVCSSDLVAKLTAYERYIIERLKASAAIGAGDYKSALASYEKVIVSPELPAEEKVGVLDSYVKLAYTAKDYARAEIGRAHV